jgi:hypothetical protein
MAQGAEPVQIQALVPEVAGKQFNEGVLNRLGRLDEADANRQPLLLLCHKLAIG